MLLARIGSGCLIFLFYISNAWSQEANLLFDIPWSYEWHTFNVSYGPPGTRGNFSDQNFNYGLELLYSKKLNTHIDAVLGIGYALAKSKIKRVYNRRFWNDYNAILTYTDKVKYSLLRIPVVLDYLFNSHNKMTITVGTSVNINFTFMQNYGYKHFSADRLWRFYFFGFSNDIHIGFKTKLSKGKYLEIQPFLRLHETWRKDNVLFEKKDQYHNLRFNSAGLMLLYKFSFK